MQSLCLHSACCDANDLVPHGGSFVVPDLPHHVTHLSVEAVEFPMSQYTVENGWNLIRIDEGVRMEEKCREVTLTEEINGKRATVNLQFPLDMNRVTEAHVTGQGKILIRTKSPHGLDVTSKDRVVDLFRPRLIAWDRAAPTELSPTLTVLSDTEFEIHLEGEGLPVKEGNMPHFDYLQCASISDINHFAKLLEGCLNGATCLHMGAIRYKVSVSDDEYICIRAQSHRGGSFRVELDGDHLADMMGLRGLVVQSHTHTQHPGEQAQSKIQQLRSILGGAGEAPGRSHDVPAPPPGVRALRPWRPGMGNARLRAGWYQPALHSICTGLPLRMEEELPAALAPLEFTAASSLAFTDAMGCNHRVTVPQGRYTIRSICDFVSKMMTRSAAHVGCEYALGFIATHPGDEWTGKFQFCCVMAEDVRTHFVLDLSLFPAERFGFARTTYWGGRMFVAEREVCVPMPDGRPVRGSYVIEEVPHLKKFRVACLPSRPMSGSVRHLEPMSRSPSSSQSVTFETKVARVAAPLSHGFVGGEVVRLFADPVGAGGSVRLIGVVQEPLSCAHCKAQDYTRDAVCECPFLLRVETRLPDGVPHRELDWTIVEEATVHPRIHFPRSGGLPPRFLGFHSHVTPPLISPILSPGTISMEHPMYVLVFIQVDSGESTLESTPRPGQIGAIGHLGRGGLTFPAGKIVTAALARDGALRCEALTPARAGRNGGRLRVRVTFANPDGSGYELHRCPFAVTLGLRGT
jgi:hypothetical protein